jgi:hypothetical protein
MAYHTIGRIRQHTYSATNPSSATAATVVISNRCYIEGGVFQAVNAAQTATAGSWTASKNGSQITGLSSVAVTTSAVGESSGVSTGTISVDSERYLAAGDLISIVGSSLVASSWTFKVREF